MNKSQLTLLILVILIIATVIYYFGFSPPEGFDTSIQESHPKPFYSPYLSNYTWYNQYTPFIWNNPENWWPTAYPYWANYYNFYNRYYPYVRYY